MRTGPTMLAAVIPILPPEDRLEPEEYEAVVRVAAGSVMVALGGKELEVVVASKESGESPDDAGGYNDPRVSFKADTNSMLGSLYTIAVMIDEYLVSFISEMDEINQLSELFTMCM